MMNRDGCKPHEIRIGDLCIPSYCNKLSCIYNAEEKEKYGKRGFLLPDGSIISTGRAGHEQVSEIYTGKLKHNESIDLFIQFALLYRFLDECHAVRFISLNKEPAHKTLTAESVHIPTHQQIEQLASMMQDKNKFYADRSDTNKNESICSFEITKTKPRPLDIQRWISRCW
jgi:hypothetical protein